MKETLKRLASTEKAYRDEDTGFGQYWLNKGLGHRKRDLEKYPRQKYLQGKDRLI